VEQAQKLIDLGANVNRQFLTEDNTTCLMGVSAVGAVEAVEFLLQAGADPNLETIQGHTALRFAVNGGHVEVVRLLIESGADVNHKAADGEAPLMIAQRLKNDQVTEVLRAAGAQE
jgi:ankyrin repeat protein